MTQALGAIPVKLPAGWTQRVAELDVSHYKDVRIVYDGPRCDAVVWQSHAQRFEAWKCYSERDGAQAWKCVGSYATLQQATHELDILEGAKVVY